MTITKSTLSQALLLGVAALGLSACQSPSNTVKPPPSSGNSNTIPTSPTTSLPAKPIASWSKPAINSSQTDAVYRQEWVKSPTKTTCPILALPKNSNAHISGHSARRANFSGGWGVAYDLPSERSAYGVANAGVLQAGDQVYDGWAYHIVYQDGSTVGYGHEGGDPSAKWLAYLVIPQNRCFYNVWSAQGQFHLEQMLSELRQVNP
ncbi:MULTISPECIES: hypothetical protein [Psychrobacter]|uniref:hypothetical protein n=1 Tax=Psychrobacter TaxID=497 RepID=UPI00146A07C8|nr:MULTISPECIES: hypothetical protein [Psychrobacter]